MTNTKEQLDERCIALNSRFILGEEGTKNLVVVGINPSIATIDNLDPTAKRIKKYSEIHKFDGWIILNLYPQIYTEVEKIDEEKNEELVKINLTYIEEILARDDITLVAAWGEAIQWRKYLMDCLRDIDALAKKYNHEWHCIELTKYGHPCHPLIRKKGFSIYSSKLKLMNESYLHK